MGKIAIYRQLLMSAEKESVIKDISHEYSEDILDYENFPEEYLEFLVEILSTKELYMKDGIYHFLVLVGTDTDIMTEEQLERIVLAIKSNYHNYLNKMLCFTVCDFIAYYYPEDPARKVLKYMVSLETEKPEELRCYAQEGLNIINTNKLLSCDNLDPH